MPSEWARKKAEELCRKAGCDCGGTGNIGREVTGYGHVCGGDDRLCQTSCPVPVQDVDYSECERFHDFAAALDEARREGEELERRECYEAATLAFAQFRGGSPAGVEQRVSEAIAARGPMRGPEEEE